MIAVGPALRISPWQMLLLLVSYLSVTAVAAQSTYSIEPFPPTGGHAVGCSNVEQDFSRVAAGESAQDYWDGLPRGSTSRYLTDLLVDPVHSMVVQPSIPDDSTLYGPYAGMTFPYVLLVCYPTALANARAGYVLPSGNAVPHMQRDGEQPFFENPSTRYPVVLYSHGLSGSPIDGDYVESVKQVASYGYVVIAPFHGDLRFADIDLDNFSDAVYALLHYKTFVAMQAVRPLSLSAALDLVLGHPDYRDHVDPEKVGAFGASLGGESTLLMAGAELTTSLGQSSSRVLFDPRLKAAVGYIPYFGVDLYPAFGRDLKGLDGVTLPYLAIGGTADTTAPLSVIERGVRRLAGTRQLVALAGLKHGYDSRYADDLTTWMFAFLAGQLSGDAVARATSARMTSVAGGMEDIERMDYMAPSPLRGPNLPIPLEAIAIEFYNDSLGHYFITAVPEEALMLDAGALVPGWSRTGFEFKVRPAGSAAGSAACRFFGTPSVGPNSHFFTNDAAECAKVKANALWTYEGLAFVTDAPVADDCAADRLPVYRIYNDGIGGQANHRYSTSRSEVRAMRDAGWRLEGTVFCAIP